MWGPHNKPIGQQRHVRPTGTAIRRPRRPGDSVEGDSSGVIVETRSLGTRLIQIPTNWLNEGTTGDLEVVTQDLIEMAEIGLAQPEPISFAYEGVAWGTHFDTCQETWELVQRVNRPNFGLCLDTYHIAARVCGPIPRQTQG